MKGARTSCLGGRAVILGTSWALIFQRFGGLVVLAIIVVALGIGSPPFLEGRNLFNILSQWAPVGIMAIGATYVILVGGFDLSSASGFALCSVVAAALADRGWPPEIDFLAALVVGIVIGMFNAFLVVAWKINPFIATLGSAFMLSGVPFLIVEDPFIMVQQPGFDTLGTGSWFGIPYSGMILVGFLVSAGIVLAKTPYGQWIYSVGGNPETSRLFGIRVRLVTATTYIFSGFCTGAAAAISTSQLSYSASQQDPGLIFDVIVAVVVGGTSLSGGFGSIWRTAVGLSILATLQNGLNLLDVNSVAQYIVKGFIIVGALALDVWVRRLSLLAARLARVRTTGHAAKREGDSSPELRPAAVLARISDGQEIAT